jgi:hypothetical protein
MNEYIELLTKIKDSMIPLTDTNDLFETIKNMIVTGTFMVIIACIIFTLFDNVITLGKFSNFVKVVSSVVFGIGMLVVIISAMGMVLYGALIPNGLSKESKVVVSNYVSEMNDQDYSRLEKLVKLHGNNLTNNDETIKQINKYLMETVGK